MARILEVVAGEARFGMSHPEATHSDEQGVSSTPGWSNTAQGLSGANAAMVEVQRQTDHWAHVHKWFHETRSNPNCPWCAHRDLSAWTAAETDYLEDK